MRHWVFVLFVFVGYVATLWAEPFDQAEVTKTINLVSLLPQDVRAAPGDLVKRDTALKTGGNSRAELQFPDLTITRVGSNALFRFIAGTREIVLDGGTMLFSSPKGAGGGKVQAGAITAAVTGSDFLISNAGRVKVICLSHKVLVYFTANPKIRAVLLPGQMLDIVPGAGKKMPPVATINLKTLLATSKLGEAGGFGPFPNQTILAYNVSKQGGGFVPANGPLPANVNLTAQAAQTVRSTTVANNPPSQSAARAAQTAPSTTATQTAPSTTAVQTAPSTTAAQTAPSTTAAQTAPSTTAAQTAPSTTAAQTVSSTTAAQTVSSTRAANNNPPSQSTGAPTATGSPPDTTGGGTGRNRGNNSNIRNIENRGNSGNAPGRAGR
jgi:outer membrane biosynthesis protein TonB